MMQEVGASAPPPNRDEAWPLGGIAFSLLPLAGTERRKTMQEEVVPGQVWTHDQIQGVISVNVPVRQTVIKLKDGGLWVHNPVAPTKECIKLMRALEAEHGKVKHIVLGTVGLEHKATAGPFSRAFPRATVWLQPGQWEFPLPVPLSFLGFPLSCKTLPSGSSFDAGEAAPPWADEIPFEVLGPLKFPAVGCFGETAFFHRASSTLMLTDTIIQVTDEPPKILAEDPRLLLYHSRDDISEEVVNSAENRRKGWRRSSLFGLFFYPSGIDVRLLQIPSDLKRQPASMAGLGDGAVPAGVQPWKWVRDDQPRFKALQSGLCVAPILQALILNRYTSETLEWVERVRRLPFKRIIPCHFANDVRAGPKEFVAAFDFLEHGSDSMPQRSGSWPFDFPFLRPRSGPIFDETNPDFNLLSIASEVCTRTGLTNAPTSGPLAESQKKAA